MTRRDPYSQFPGSPLGTPGTMTPFWRTRKKKKKKKKNRLHFLSLAAKASKTNNTVIFTLLIVDLDSTRVMHVIAIYFAFLT